MNVYEWHRIHFIGIGGVGMSALARFFNSLGREVSGYDATPSELTHKLSMEGINVTYEAQPKLMNDALDVVIYTPAIPRDHSELVAALQIGLPVLKRAEVLGLISERFETIAVAGTHGKTTTSCMVSHILMYNGLQPTSILGGISLSLNGNFGMGEGKYLVTEADEFDRSFLRLSVDKLIVTSLDEDHLDIYNGKEDLVETYKTLIGKVNTNGVVIMESDVIDYLKDRLSEWKEKGLKTLSYGRRRQADYKLEKVEVQSGMVNFEFVHEKKFYRARLGLPGEHNVHNALAALALTNEVGVELENGIKALVEFKGIRRRFEKRYDNNGVVIIDDYAHHPVEVKAAIEAAKMLYPERKIKGIFQAHLYSRTRDFMDEFARAFKELDEIWTCEIYPAREKPIEGITGEALFKAIEHKNKVYTQKSKLVERMEIKRGDVILILGAGNINSIVTDLENKIEAVI